MTDNRRRAHEWLCSIGRYVTGPGERETMTDAAEARGRAEERAAIVAWLRIERDESLLAFDIERGAHRGKP